MRAAAARISRWAHRTPIMRSATLDARAGRSVACKCEIFQRTGSFKFRGACNAVMRLADADASRGVVTHSSGNHAQALACAAKLGGITAHVVMPDDSSPAKIAAVEGYGGRVILCRPTLADRAATAARVQADTGAILIPPYDHPDVIAGQGTIALELVEDLRDIEAVVVPVGGGGLISGITLAIKALRPDVKIIGAEPLQVSDAAESKRLGTRQDATGLKTIADGLRTSLGDLTWPVVRDHVDSIETVTEDEIRAAIRLVYERMKLVIEPTAGVGVAALLGPLRERRDFGPCCVILCGGNVDLAALPSLVAT